MGPFAFSLYRRGTAAGDAHGMLQSRTGGKTMTITLTPGTEARLREKAEREGREIDAVAEALIAAALEREAQDGAEGIEGLRRGDEAAAEGRERPLAAFFAEQRAKPGFPWTGPNVRGQQAR